MIEQDFMNMLSKQIKAKSLEHPGIPIAELTATVLMTHIAILYAKVEQNEIPRTQG